MGNPSIRLPLAPVDQPGPSLPLEMSHLRTNMHFLVCLTQWREPGEAEGHKEMSSILADQNIYEPKCEGWWGGGGGCGVSANEYSCAHHEYGAQVNFGDLTPYLIYMWRTIHCRLCIKCYGIGKWKGGGECSNSPLHTQTH